MNTLGITTASFSAGVSLVTAIPGPSLNQYVYSRDIVDFSGGSLLIGGQTVLNGAGYVPISPAALPYRIDGPAPFFMSAVGATTTVQVVTNLTRLAGQTLIT